MILVCTVDKFHCNVACVLLLLRICIIDTAKVIVLNEQSAFSKLLLFIGSG